LEAICAEAGFQYTSVGTAGPATQPFLPEMLVHLSVNESLV